jgi:F-type H+-transporting ATPase subunit a
MKKILTVTFLTSIFSAITSRASASEGFTWLSQIANATGIEQLFHHNEIEHFEHVLTFFFVGVLLLVGTLVYRSKTANRDAAVVPDKGISFKNISEMYGSFILTQCRAVLGEKDGPKYFPFVATIFILIFISNAIGLIPGFLPPTESINTTLALGVFSFLYFNIKGCKELGTLNYLKHFAGPLWYMAVLIFPIEIISVCIRPVSLALRLYGNMYGDHTVLGTFSNLAPLGVPVVFMLLGLLVSFIQAYVFIMLSMVYVSLATAHQDHGEHAAHH